MFIRELTFLFILFLNFRAKDFHRAFIQAHAYTLIMHILLALYLYICMYIFGQFIVKIEGAHYLHV